MSDFFRENILEHYKYPRNYGSLKKPDAFAEDANPLCGDRMKFELKYKSGKITSGELKEIACSKMEEFMNNFVKGIEHARKHIDELNFVKFK
jgi:nitrogen fixation NifU-like protein